MQLRCFDPTCASKLELHSPAMACPNCGGLLEVDVDGLKVDAGALKELWSERRRSRDPRDISGVWRYREFLPDLSGERDCNPGRRQHAAGARAQERGLGRG